MIRFAAFILTNGRPDNVVTVKTLKTCGYTGDVYLLVDDMDETKDQYIEKYGDKVIVFDKKESSKLFDSMDNFEKYGAIVYARNACFVEAAKLGLDNFIQLDDDYTTFDYRFNDKLEYLPNPRKVKNLDYIFELFIDYLYDSGCDMIAMAQGGDFIGGSASSQASTPKMKRKCMNTFFCKVASPVVFNGTINEDVNTYTAAAGRGLLLGTLTHMAIVQKQTQSNDGGMTDIYLDGGTYVKSFYSVICSPSCVRIAEMGSTHKRLHHRVTFRHAVPKIIRETHKK